MNPISRGLRASMLVGVMVLVAAACSSGPGASSTPEISPLANSEWTLSSMLGRPVQSGTNVTLNFAIIKAGGLSVCNQYQMQYATLDTGLRFGPAAATSKSCGELTDGLEAQYFTTLGLITHYEMSGDTLTLRSAPGDADLIYARAVPATVDGPWNITHVNNGQQAVVTIPTGVSATISFLPDNLIEGFGGCNNFNSDYVAQSSGDISFGPFMSTKKLCGEPADSFEAQLLAALTNSTKWSVTAGTLDLRDAGGAQQVEATSAIGH